MRMTFDEAVELILSRLETPEPEQRAARDKVRKRITYALGTGKLPRLELQTLDIDRDQLIYWARTKWPGRFNIPITVPGHLADGANFGGNADATHLPTDLQACHLMLMNAAREMEILKLLISSQAAHITRLKPLAEQYERNREQNRSSARKPRDGRE